MGSVTSAVVLDRFIAAPSEVEETISPSDSDEETSISPHSHRRISGSTWREDLVKFFSATNSPLPDLDLVCHLIDLFWIYGNAQAGLIIPAGPFFEGLKEGVCSLALCYAMCASGVRFSCHNSIQVAREALARDFAQRARDELHVTPDERPLARVQTYCVLIAYEASRGNGAQAWSDLGKFERLLTLYLRPLMASL